MSSSNKSPVYPMPEHFSDYGFDPQFDYFQVLEDARNKQSEDLSRSIDSLRFKLHKPTATDLGTPFSNTCNEKKKKKRRWWWWNWKWNKALTFLRRSTKPHMIYRGQEEDRDVHLARARDFRAAAYSSVSGPLYFTQTPPHDHRSQPLPAGLMSPASACSSPYLSLRELNMEQQHLHRMSASASPIYMVT